MKPILRVLPRPSAAVAKGVFSNRRPLRTMPPLSSQRAYSSSSYGDNSHPGGERPTQEKTRKIEHPDENKTNSIGPPPPMMPYEQPPSEEALEGQEPGQDGDHPQTQPRSSHPPPASIEAPSDERDTDTETTTGATSSPSKTSRLKTPPIPSNMTHPTLNDGKQSPNVDENGERMPDIPEDVERHNCELEQRYDRAYNQIGDGGNVQKGFSREEDHH